MKSRSNYALFLSQLEGRPYISIFIIALALRLLLLAVGFVDYWGDAHHNLIMSKLTLENGFVYSDFKDRNLTWLPFYRYWGSLIMFVSGTYSLLVMNITNTIIGASVAVLATRFGVLAINKKTGILIGLAVALMPYLIVFSYISMAEMMGALLLLSWLFSLYKEQYLWAGLFALLAALTRYELIFLIGITMIPFLYLRNYKAITYSVAGLILGLGIWSWWAYLNSGNPINWLLMRIESTTGSNSFYTEGVNRWHKNVLVPITTLLQAFPLIVFFIWVKRPKKKYGIKEHPWFFVMGYLTIIHWLFFFAAQFKIIAYPDPRFFILSLPITIIWFFSLYQRGYFIPFVRNRILFLFLTVSLIQLVVPYYRQYSLQPRKEAGEWIKENIKEDELILSDLAVSIVESERDPNWFISSDKLIPKSIRNKESEEDFIAYAIGSKEIGYITSYNAPFDYTQTLWPEIKEQQPFEWNGITFVPVFTYAPFKYTEEGLHNFLRAQFEAPLQTATVWKLYRN